MVKPLIGITMHAVREPFLRSAVNQQYVEAVLGAGGTPLCIPLGMDPESVDRLYGMIDGLLLPGGRCPPSRYGHEPHPQLGT
jgi:putative glutamine amidotransferase